MSKSDNDNIREIADKNVYYFLLMNKWTRLLQDNKSVINYFTRNGYKRIAIYGYGLVGETFERELRNSNIKIEYIVDQNAEYMYALERLICPQDVYEDVDILVVTTFDKDGELIKNIRNKCKFKVESILDIINGV